MQFLAMCDGEGDHISRAEGFKEGGGVHVVGVRTQCYMASYWPTD